MGWRRMAWRRGVLLAGLGALYLLHNDFWNWGAPHRVAALWGLPAGFVWHVALCLAAAGWMAAMVRWWPE